MPKPIFQRLSPIHCTLISRFTNIFVQVRANQILSRASRGGQVAAASDNPDVSVALMAAPVPYFLPRVLLMTGFVLTLGWTAVLGYGFITLARALL
jgi:hypothetical protein